MEDAEELIKNIEDDIIRRAGYLLFILAKKEPIGSALEKTQQYLKKNGWTLKAEDREFLEKIRMKSYRDVYLWVDHNMVKIR